MEIKSNRTSEELLSSVKILLSINGGEKDTLLSTLLEDAYSIAVSVTGREEIPSTLLTRMVCEDYSRTDGIAKIARAGMSEEYLNGYSNTVLAYLRSLRKIKIL
ncbi:MAG: hypothetical protein IJW10_02145 [Clostridia bacterium]|nr:hypothetical protein [Clostridia bacterium]